MERGLDTGAIANLTITTDGDFDKTIICLWIYKDSIVADFEYRKPNKYE
jgi:hypothetical protein